MALNTFFLYCIMTYDYFKHIFSIHFKNKKLIKKQKKNFTLFWKQKSNTIATKQALASIQDLPYICQNMNDG